MTRLLDYCRRIRSVVMAAAAWLLACGLAWAQRGESKGSESSGGGGGIYVLPYALVIFCIALGVFIVVHPSKRRERAKPEAYGKPK